jgi:N-acyl homoserine lactone hydrolase
MKDATVRRVDFGYFVRPAEETGTGAPRVEPCLGYVVEHPDATVLMDTGMGAHPEIDSHYRPRRQNLHRALGEVGLHADGIDIVVNCHLHFDHCGGNPELPGRPILVQRAELAVALSSQDYTLPELIDVSGMRYEQLDGESEIVPGVLVMPTPGHTAGHQSLVVRRADGTVIVAGQSHDTATSFGADALAWRARRDGHPPPLSTPPLPTPPVPTPPSWMNRLLEFDPRRVVFAHDHAVWEAG